MISSEYEHIIESGKDVLELVGIGVLLVILIDSVLLVILLLKHTQEKDLGRLK